VRCANQNPQGRQELGESFYFSTTFPVADVSRIVGLCAAQSKSVWAAEAGESFYFFSVDTSQRNVSL
jgi:hypothetical protein